MTKGIVLKQYFKKMTGLELSGNSMLSVIKDYYRQKYNYSPKGSTLSSILEDCIENNVGGKLYD